MIDPDKAKGWFDSIKDTPIKDRIFVLMLFMIFLLVGTNIASWIHLTNKEKQATELKIQAERDLDISRNSNLKDNKDYNSALVKAEKECNERWALKFEAERELNKKLQEERANRLEQELNYLKGESKRLKQEAKTIKQKVSI